jgi:zinc transport system permease protein
MLDDFFARALLAGIGVACVTGPLGCFVVWRKMAYFGATLSHSALLGVALALLVNIDPMIGVLVQCIVIVPALLLLERHSELSTDSHLGILAHGTLALGLVLFGLMTWVRVDLMGYLFGDILAVSKSEVLLIYVAGSVVIGALLWIWRPLLASTVNHDIAAAEGLRPDRARIAFMFLLAGVIAIGMKLVGILLAMAGSPERMALGSALIGILAVVSGLHASKWWDVAAGPAIVLAALIIFAGSLLPLGRWLTTASVRPHAD